MKTGKWLLLLSLSLGTVFTMNPSSFGQPDDKAGGSGSVIETNLSGMALFINSDLFHRAYNMGTNLMPGKISIKNDDILKACETPDAVLIYSSDVTYDSLPFDDRDLEYEIKSPGHYCFFVLNKDGSLIDITDTISSAAGKLDHMLPKQPKNQSGSYLLL